MTSRRGFLLQDLPDENLDQILSLSPMAKGKYFAGIAKEFYPDLKERAKEDVDVVLQNFKDISNVQSLR